MIKLVDILKEINNIYQNDIDTWTHATDRVEVINTIKSKKKWLGVNEDPNDFSYTINAKRLSADKQNTNVPNFYKGSLYPGASQKYLITFTPKQKYPGDNFESSNWKEVDYPLIPNSNRVNRLSFNASGKIGVLKPEYRGIENFKFYQLDPSTKKYVEFDIENFK